MFFELRQYQLRPGKRDEWVKLMDEVIIPFQMSKGMVIHGSFVDEENDVYVWMRRFESEDERKRLYASVYENDWWQNEMSDKVGEMIDREKTVVRVIKATPRSFMQ